MIAAPMVTWMKITISSNAEYFGNRGFARAHAKMVLSYISFSVSFSVSVIG